MESGVTRLGITNVTRVMSKIERSRFWYQRGGHQVDVIRGLLVDFGVDNGNIGDADRTAANDEIGVLEAHREPKSSHRPMIGHPWS